MAPIRALLAAAAIASTGAAQAQATWNGWLCCNMRTDGSWITDINYDESHKTLIPAGTPVEMTGYGRYRVNTKINGKAQGLGNDYSRDIDLETFAKRYILTEDPRAKIAGAPAKVRDAIKAAKVAKGMTREQVRMAVGWPVTSENRDPNAKILRYWLGSFAEFQVLFDDAGRVTDVTADPATRQAVYVP